MMTEFLQQIMAFPTVIFTSLLALVLLYWMFVIFGALDVDMFGVDGAAEGAAEGAFEGAGEGLAEGAGEGLAEGLGEAAGEGAAEAAGEGVEGVAEGLSLASLIGLRKAPFTVIASMLILVAWAFCFLGMQYLAPVLDGALPHWLSATVVTGISLVAAMPVTGISARPLAPLFQTHVAGGRADLVGKTCIIDTGSVDATFGQATVEEDGGWMKVAVRCDKGDRLRRGDEALIIAYDSAQEVFKVEPLHAREDVGQTGTAADMSRRRARDRDGAT